MSIVTLYSSNAFFRASLKTLVFVLSSAAALFCASTGFGLLKMLFRGLSAGSNIGLAELSTHSGLTLVFFVLAVLSADLARKCFW
jgi:hypothetical protein